MVYELYVDVLFMVNFTMDYLILLLSWKIIKSNTSYKRIFIGGLLGAFLTCLVLVFTPGNIVVRFLLCHLFINTIMIFVGLKVKSMRDFIRGFITLYIASVLLGGVFQIFSQYATVGSLFFLFAVFSYWCVTGIWYFISKLGMREQEFYQVEIYFGEKVFEVKGLLDTGNGLRDAISQKPVCILDKNVLDICTLNIPKEKIRHIPYQTIGNSGCLLGVVVDKIHILGHNDIWIREGIIGISKENISKTKSYEMILHPDIFTHM